MKKELKHYHNQSRWQSNSNAEKKAYHDMLQKQFNVNHPESLYEIEEIISIVAEKFKK